MEAEIIQGSSSTGLRIEKVITSGTFELDGGSWEVDNNIWIIGDERECFIIDAAHSVAPIVGNLGDRHVKGIICTHAHNDHITVAPELSQKTDSPIYLHPGDDILWKQTHPEHEYQVLSDGQKFSIAGTEVLAVNTPGHSPGSLCLYVPEAKVLFSGDTLFEGGPGATGRSFSDFDTIICSLQEKVLSLPEDVEVYTGHGGSTSIGAEAPHIAEWIARGY